MIILLISVLFLLLGRGEGISLEVCLGEISWNLIHKLFQRTFQFDLIEKGFCLVVYSIKNFLVYFHAVVCSISFLCYGKCTLKRAKYVRCILPYHPFKRQPNKMVKHTQMTRQQFADRCLSVFSCFVGLAMKGLNLLNTHIPMRDVS